MNIKNTYNGHSPKLSIWLGHITWVHIHAKFEEVHLYTSVVISTSFEQRKMLFSKLSTTCAKAKFSKYFGHNYTLY